MWGIEARRTLSLGLLGAAVAMVLCGLLSYYRVAESWGIDRASYDWLVRWRMRHAAVDPGPIVLVMIDEDSLAEIGLPWPWPRHLHAEMTDRLREAGATAIGFDLLFLEASTEEADAAFAASLDAHGKAVIAAKLERTQRRAGDAMELAGMSLERPLPRFRDVADYGIVSFDWDPDMAIRRFVPAFDLPLFSDEPYPSFATRLYELARGELPPGPLDQSREIAYVGPSGSFTQVSAVDLLFDQVNPTLFAGKIVLIGVSFADAHDMHATPVSPAAIAPMPGVEIHANILSCLLRNDFLAPVGRGYQAALAAFVALLAAYFAIFRGGLPTVLGYLLIAAAIGAGALWLMAAHGLHLDLSYPLLAMPIGYLLAGLPLRRRLTLNTKVGPYLLYEELGRGGMAVVYRGRHPKTHQEVAIKQLLGQSAASPAVVSRFLKEIELVRQLEHPNIVHIVDAGEVNGAPYCAMEYIKGHSLMQLLQERHRLDGSEVRRLVAPIARALASSHEVGVIHRDLKPSNIMLSETGVPKLMDFGIARQLSEAHLTQDGTLLGTPHYMSPEQCRGEDVTDRADIYSLGATMYHLLAGAPPFNGSCVADVLRHQIYDPAPDVRKRNQQIDEELAALVTRCLEKEPANRPATMADVARVLDPFYVPPTRAMPRPTGAGHESLCDGPTQQIAAPDPP